MTNYVVANVKPWNLEAFRRRKIDLPGRWHLFETPEDLSVERLGAIAPRYIFFPHWSWNVPEEIFEWFERVCLILIALTGASLIELVRLWATRRLPSQSMSFLWC